MSAKFPLGVTVITPNALRQLHSEDVVQSLARHGAGDWEPDGAWHLHSDREAGRLYART